VIHRKTDWSFRPTAKIGARKLLRGLTAMAEIIKHNDWESSYDDPGHPIPALRHLDVCTIKKGGGADLHIIIATPLQADDYSLNRLLNKIEGYLGHLQGDNFKKEAGEANPENTNIVVRIHPDSCREAFLLLEKSVEWVKDNKASLKVVELKDE
jgi:hypothetical protein